MPDYSQMKLGRKAIKTDTRTLRLARYLKDTLPPAPAAVHWSSAVRDFGMLDNDTLGDCTIAAALHLSQCWSANASAEFTPTNAEALAAYEAICGYNPAVPSSDQGGVELDVLQAWKSQGIGGRRIMAYASVNPRNATEIEQAAWIFGGVYIGLPLPVSAQRQDIWWYVGHDDGGVWGGHAVPIVDYDPEYLTVVTWGALKRMTWEFFHIYCDEAYAAISADWLNARGMSPDGFDLGQLQADLASIV